MTSDKKFEGEDEARAQAAAAGQTQGPSNETTLGAGPQQETEEAGAGAVEEVTQLKTEVAELKDRLLRAHAEMDNVRKRLEREKADQAKFAITKFARDIVGIGDNVQRAIEAVPQRMVEQDTALKSFFDGVSMIERELLTTLGRHGIKRLDPKGEPFDPHHHQAVVEVPSDEVPAGSVTQVFQSGYMIEDRVLRPAMVAVSKGGVKPQPPAQAVEAELSSSEDGNSEVSTDSAPKASEDKPAEEDRG